MTSLACAPAPDRRRRRRLRFWPVGVVLVALTLVPAEASAQAPTGDQIRAQARAFGDAALALERESKRLDPRIERALGKRPGLAPCLEELEGLPVGTESSGAFAVILADVLPPAARILSPAVDRFVARLGAAGPGEPILASGAAGWRESASVYRRLAAIRASTCSLIRAWKRRGFRRSAIPPEVTALSEALPRLGRSTTKIARAERRLLQLGVKSRAARAFNADLLFSGAFGEDGGGAFGSTEVSTETEVSPAR